MDNENIKAEPKKHAYTRSESEAELRDIKELREICESKNILRNTATKVYHNLVKQNCKAELKNLIKAELIVEDKFLKMPDTKLIPPMPEKRQLNNVDEFIQNYKQTKKALDLL